MLIVLRLQTLMTSVVEIFIGLGPYCMPHHDLIDPLFLQKKISSSLLHLVPKILGPKVSLFIRQNVLFNSF